MLAHEILAGSTQSITAILDQQADKILKDFRCNACGRIIFQYYGSIKLIMPGGVELDWIDIVGRPKPIQCKNQRLVTLPGGKEVKTKCKTVYYVIG